MYIAHISDLHIGDPSKPGEENLKRVIGEINRFCARFCAKALCRGFCPFE